MTEATSSTHVVRTKDGVRFDRIAPAGFVILAALHAASQVFSQDVWISCGTEAHPAVDPHTLGEAFDVSVATCTPDDVMRLKTFLEKALSSLFMVQYESPYQPDDAKLRTIVTINAQATAPHIHVQRRRGTIYPPPAAQALQA